MNETEIRRRAAEVARILEEETEAGRIPGAIFGVWRDGAEELCVLRGMGDLAKGRKLTRNSLFRIYSMTKPVTAAAAAMLMEEGRLKAEDPVSRYLPEYEHLRVIAPDGSLKPCRTVMTVRHLLTMTSGLVYPDTDAAGSCMQRCFDTFEADNLAGHGPSTRELARLIAGQPLAFEPGSSWRYGLSADVLGAVIEVVSGMKFSDFLRERFFDPLGMTDTGFHVPPEKAERLTELYKYEAGALVPDQKRHLALTPGLRPPTFESGGAGLFTTLNDYARFGLMLAGGGQYNGIRFLSESTVDRFRQGLIGREEYPSLNWDSLTGYRYGFLMRACRSPEEALFPGTPGEFGWDGWTGPSLSVDPADRRLILLFLQVGGFDVTPLIRRLKPLVMSRP